MSWRPKNWEDTINNLRNWQDHSEIELFETGADAMLKVLMDEGVIYYGQLDWLQDKEDEVSEA